MTLVDWTRSGVGNASLDGTIKYAGASSLLLNIGLGAEGNQYFTHNTFSNNRAQVILWTRASYPGYATINMYVGLSTYGHLSVMPDVQDDWQKFRASFWYDLTTNTRWGRVEKWNGAAWVQVGGDTNFGTGSPANGSLILEEGYSCFHCYTVSGSVWFDELEVYS